MLRVRAADRRTKSAERSRGVGRIYFRRFTQECPPARKRVIRGPAAFRFPLMLRSILRQKRETPHRIARCSRLRAPQCVAAQTGNSSRDARVSRRNRDLENSAAPALPGRRCRQPAARARDFRQRFLAGRFVTASSSCAAPLEALSFARRRQQRMFREHARRVDRRPVFPEVSRRTRLSPAGPSAGGGAGTLPRRRSCGFWRVRTRPGGRHEIVGGSITPSRVSPTNEAP